MFRRGKGLPRLVVMIGGGASAVDKGRERRARENTEHTAESHGAVKKRGERGQGNVSIPT